MKNVYAGCASMQTSLAYSVRPEAAGTKSRRPAAAPVAAAHSIRSPIVPPCPLYLPLRLRGSPGGSPVRPDAVVCAAAWRQANVVSSPDTTKGVLSGATRGPDVEAPRGRARELAPIARS